MAKTPKTAPDQEGEISVTMIKFGMKGSDASLQKGLDTIKAAFVQAGFVAMQEVKQIRSTGPRHLPPANGEEPETEVAEQVQAEDEVEDAVAASPPPLKKQAASPRKPPNYKIMNELKFEDVKPTLPAFFAEKKPKTDFDRYLCIAYWFKHHKGVEDLTVPHFFTAYMTYKWTLPTNASTPVADLRHKKRQLFVAGKTGGTWTISNGGERRVNEMGKDS